MEFIGWKSEWTATNHWRYYFRPFVRWFIFLESTNFFKGKQLTIAGKLGAEPDIIINMYKALIEENSDIQVTLKPNFGKTTFI